MYWIYENTVFNFQVQAYNDTTSIIGNFSLILDVNYAPGATRVYATLYGKDRLLYIDLFTSQDILIGSIFRMGDPDFGYPVNKPRILLCENLDNPSNIEIADILEGTRRTYLNLGKVEFAQAVVNNVVVYEVLYRRIIDDSAGALLQYIDPITETVINPGSLSNIRTKLITLGFSGGEENLPLWMTSEQTIGDSSSVLGWTSALEFAYVVPGAAQAIANKINSDDVSLQKLFMNRVRVDRLICEPAADTTFEPFNILYDNIY